MFEICDYNKSNKTFGILDWTNNQVKWLYAKQLIDMCKNNSEVRVRGLLNNGVILYPVSASFDDETCEAIYCILHPSKSIKDFLISNNFEYKQTRKLYISVVKSMINGNIHVHLYQKQKDNRNKYIEITNNFMVAFYRETNVRLDDYCIDLVANYRHPYFKKYFNK